MKVRLTAFNGLLKSEVMDWPETGHDPDYRMLCPSLRGSILGMMKEWERPLRDRQIAELRFRHTGHGEMDEETNMYIQEFELIRVTPDYWYRDGQDDNLEEKKS